MAEPSKTAWLKPTTLSPACEFEVPSKAQRVLSRCGMWSCAVSGALGKPRDTFGKHLCPLCVAGKKADGVLVKRK